jgi:hypothetical protein
LGEEVIRIFIGREWECEDPGGTQRRREWRWDIDCLINRAGEVAERCFLDGATNPDHWAKDRDLIELVLDSDEGKTIDGFQPTREWKVIYQTELSRRAEELLRRPEVTTAVHALAEHLLKMRANLEASAQYGQAVPRIELSGEEVKKVVMPALKSMS